jgi:hypothetical protein
LGEESSRSGGVSSSLLIAKSDVSDPVRLRNPCEVGDGDANHAIHRIHTIHLEGIDYQVVPVGHLGLTVVVAFGHLGDVLDVSHVWCLFSIKRQRGPRDTERAELLAGDQPDQFGNEPSPLPATAPVQFAVCA